MKVGLEHHSTRNDLRRSPRPSSRLINYGPDRSGGRNTRAERGADAGRVSTSNPSFAFGAATTHCLHIAARSPVETHLEMSFASRACHFLLLPPLVARVCEKYYASVKCEYSAAELRVLVLDSLVVKKFKMVRNLSLQEDHLLVATETGLWDQCCASLETVNVFPDSSRTVSALFRLSFPQLRSFGIFPAFIANSEAAW